jgi:hypothetical protein
MDSRQAFWHPDHCDKGPAAGVTEDGRLIELARFESEDAARANSNRPEQDRCWAETANPVTGAATFHDGSDGTLDLTGDPAAAGFVQLMQGRGSDPDRAWEPMAQLSVARPGELAPEGGRTPNLAPDGPNRPAQTALRTAVGWPALARRCCGAHRVRPGTESVRQPGCQQSSG